MNARFLFPRPILPRPLFPRRFARAVAIALPLATAVAALLPSPAQAHRAWLLPSATVLSSSGDDVWVTVDAAASNDLFYFEHQPIRLGNLKIHGPDGKEVAAQNQATGRYRSVFDVKLNQSGTYKIEIVNDVLFASYRQDGETKRLRGNAETLRKSVPANVQDLSVSRNNNRLQTFVTTGKPTTTAIEPSGQGLEVKAVTHPNDLFAGETATFALVLDGKPLADVPVEVVPGGVRYRDQLDDVTVKTDKDGRFTVKWPTPGLYWMSASYPVQVEGQPPATGGTIDKPRNRYSYAVTVEVLAE